MTAGDRAIRALRTLQRQLASPPPGWHTFGTHIGQPEIALEFWGDDGAGFPIWERPAPSDLAVDIPGRASTVQRLIDNEPCAKCGGDKLCTDFTGSGRCHASSAPRPEQQSS